MTGTMFSLYLAGSSSLSVSFIVLGKVQHGPHLFLKLQHLSSSHSLGQAFGALQWPEPWEMNQHLCHKCLCDLDTPFGSLGDQILHTDS